MLIERCCLQYNDDEEGKTQFVCILVFYHMHTIYCKYTLFRFYIIKQVKKFYYKLTCDVDQTSIVDVDQTSIVVSQ